MSRTFKDKKQENAKRPARQPKLKRAYRAVLEGGFEEDMNCDACPDCGAELIFERGFLTCEECGWGSLFPKESDPELGLEFSHVA
jgi:hypothetical protein